VATIRDLYDGATHREERYAALALAAHRYYRAFATAPPSLTLYEHLIKTGAWWDLVDEVSHRVGDVLRAHHDVASVIRTWSTADDLWVRRSAIICQVGHKSDTDLALLSDVIEPNIGDRDFFIRKAIGWALREVAYVEPEWVHSFIDGHRALAPLSVREATKHIGPSGLSGRTAPDPGRSGGRRPARRCPHGPPHRDGC
jgi:3-methyladenine DNA glycosylase AlkD